MNCNPSKQSPSLRPSQPASHPLPGGERERNRERAGPGETMWGSGAGVSGWAALGPGRPWTLLGPRFLAGCLEASRQRVRARRTGPMRTGPCRTGPGPAAATPAPRCALRLRAPLPGSGPDRRWVAGSELGAGSARCTRPLARPPGTDPRGPGRAWPGPVGPRTRTPHRALAMSSASDPGGRFPLHLLVWNNDYRQLEKELRDQVRAGGPTPCLGCRVGPSLPGQGFGWG